MSGLREAIAGHLGVDLDQLDNIMAAVGEMTLRDEEGLLSICRAILADADGGGPEFAEERAKQAMDIVAAVKERL